MNEPKITSLNVQLPHCKHSLVFNMTLHYIGEQLLCFKLMRNMYVKHFTEFLKMMKQKMEASILENHSSILIP
ncbi:unnamed protein product [Brassica napus]|uniref:(rape) hypothetical protein n=1 Tax=Brassica napus TaxID=3708 RepID=A0A816L8I4_BRANA|nr:unnamed protein product [Brassica napus]